MRVLVVGAGIIGSIYGWALAESGHEVVHLVRSGRAATLCDGMKLDVFDRRKGHKRNFCGLYKLDAVETLSPTDTFELVIVPVKHYALRQTLKEIVPRLGAAEFLLLTQNWRGTEEIDASPSASTLHIWGRQGRRNVFWKHARCGTEGDRHRITGRRTNGTREKSRRPIRLSGHTNRTSFEHAALPLGSICDDRRSVGSTRSRRNLRCDAE